MKFTKATYCVMLIFLACLSTVTEAKRRRQAPVVSDKTLNNNDVQNAYFNGIVKGGVEKMEEGGVYQRNKGKESVTAEQIKTDLLNTCLPQFDKNYKTELEKLSQQTKAENRNKILLPIFGDEKTMQHVVQTCSDYKDLNKAWGDNHSFFGKILNAFNKDPNFEDNQNKTKEKLDELKKVVASLSVTYKETFKKLKGNSKLPKESKMVVADGAKRMNRKENKSFFTFYKRANICEIIDKYLFISSEKLYLAFVTATLLDIKCHIRKLKTYYVPKDPGFLKKVGVSLVMMGVTSALQKFANFETTQIIISIIRSAFDKLSKVTKALNGSGNELAQEVAGKTKNAALLPVTQLGYYVGQAGYPFFFNYDYARRRRLRRLRMRRHR